MKNFFATTAIALCLALPAGAEDYQPDSNAKSGGNIVVTYKDDGWIGHADAFAFRDDFSDADHSNGRRQCG